GRAGHGPRRGPRRDGAAPAAARNPRGVAPRPRSLRSHRPAGRRGRLLTPIPHHPPIPIATSTVARELKKTTNDAVKHDNATDEPVQKTVNETATGLKETSERVFLAGLGAFALAEEEGSKFFDKLVKKGRKVQLPELAPLKQVRKGLDEGAEAVTGRAKDARYM